MPNYEVIVFKNGEIIRWRLRDANCNGFKCCLGENTLKDLSGAFEHNSIDPDDCDGEEFATICRLISNM